MNSTTKVQTPDTHLPRFHKEARQMALELGELSVENLAKAKKSFAGRTCGKNPRKPTGNYKIWSNKRELSNHKKIIKMSSFS